MPFRRRTRNRVSLSFQTMTFILASAGLLALMTACGSLATGSDSPPEAAPAEPSDATATPAEPAPATATPEPTVVFDFQASSALVGSPQDTPEGTFELYLRDAINQAVRLQHERLDIRIHYEDPEILAQDLGGLVVDVDLLRFVVDAGQRPPEAVVGAVGAYEGMSPIGYRGSGTGLGVLFPQLDELPGVLPEAEGSGGIEDRDDGLYVDAHVGDASHAHGAHGLPAHPGHHPVGILYLSR